MSVHPQAQTFTQTMTDYADLLDARPAAKRGLTFRQSCNVEVALNMYRELLKQALESERLPSYMQDWSDTVRHIEIVDMDKAKAGEQPPEGTDKGG
jgi:hypothetical protein